MSKQIPLTDSIRALVQIHEHRYHLGGCLHPYFDYWIYAETRLFTHRTYSGAVYYSRQSVILDKYKRKHNLMEETTEDVVEETVSEAPEAPVESVEAEVEETGS